ncbi:MAG: DegT/DnrJ/EryC1/StrS family aminotransferase [Planctomycetota bacterium]
MNREFPIPHSRATLVAEMAEAVTKVLASGQHAGGSICREFEADLARRLGHPHAIAVQSGSAALHMALLGLGVGAGDRVLLPSYVCPALLNAIAAVGASPLLADVDARFFNLTADSCRAALAREGVREEAVALAIVPHTFGYPAPLDRWDLDIPVLEDCAMALGAELEGEEVGGWGRVSIFSFYATKMISTGQGGMLVTDDAQLAEEVRDFLKYDERDEWRPSWNYPMTDLAAAMGRAQLAHLEEFLRARREIASHYRDVCHELGVDFQQVDPEASPNYFRFTILSDAKQRLERDLRAEGIEAKSPVFRPLHRYLRLDPADFPATEAIQQRALSLPIYPSLSSEQQQRIVQALRRYLG